MIDVFESSSYKDVLRRMIEAQGHKRGYQGRLAVAAKCQKSFMSQVVNGDAHLNLDQAALISNFWEFDETATEYFLTLVQEARADAKPLRRHLQKKREDLRRKVLGPGTNERSYSLPPELQAKFYSRWYTSGIFMLCGVEGCDEDAMAERLSIPRTKVDEELAFLVDAGLIECIGKGRYRKQRYNLWLDDPSHLMGFRYGWRAVGARKLALKDDEEMFYTSLFTLPRSELVTLYAILSRAIRDIREATTEVPEEDLVCLVIDLFKV